MNNNDIRDGHLAGLVRALTFGILTALPLGGLILFFEITRPAELRTGNAVATQLTALAPQATVKATPRNRYAVARFKGVSAELSSAKGTLPDTPQFSASDAERVFAASSMTLNVGFQSEFTSKEGRRVAARIVSREPIGDQVIPETNRTIDVTPASTAKLVSFVWEAWLYRVELEDRGPEPEVVVQKLL